MDLSSSNTHALIHTFDAADDHVHTDCHIYFDTDLHIYSNPLTDIHSHPDAFLHTNGITYTGNVQDSQYK